MNIQNPARAMLSRVPGLNGAIDKMNARISAIWNVQHKVDGSHAAITADSISVADLDVAGHVGSLDFGDASRSIVLGGTVLHPNGGDIRNYWDPYPTATLDQNAIIPVHEFERDLVPAVSESIDLGVRGKTNRYFRNGLFSGTVEAGEIYGVNGLFERERTKAVGVWETYTPSFTGFTVGNGSVAGRVSRVGELVFWRVTCVLGTTSAMTGTLQFTMPVATSAISGIFKVGDMMYYDASAGVIEHGYALIASGTLVTCYVSADAGANAASPWVWAAGDQFILTGWYEEL